jgi:hypothetical protein
MRENATEFENNMQMGHDAAWEQHWKQAAAFYQLALDTNHDDPTALISLMDPVEEANRHAAKLIVKLIFEQILTAIPEPRADSLRGEIA